VSIERLKRYTRFYVAAVWSIYAYLGLFLFGFGLMGSPLGFYILWGSVFLGLVMSSLAIALLVIALVIFAQLPKVKPEFTKSGKIGGWSAVGFAVLSIASLIVLSSSVFRPLIPVVWLLNPVTLGLALLVIHQVLMRKAKAMLVL
jgi:hypothetical protein